MFPKAGFLITLAAIASAAFGQNQTVNESDALIRSGLASLQAKKFQEAEAAFRKLADLQPANVAGPFGVAQVCMAQEKATEAQKVLEEAAGKNPTRPEFFAALGDVAFRARRFDYALEQFQKALALLDFKTSGTFYLHRGTIGPDPLITAVSAFAGPDATPKGAAGLELRIAEVYNAKGDAASAIAALRKARELQPRDNTILASLGLALESSGQGPEAITIYREALQNDPNQPLVMNNLAYLLAETGGDLFEALRLARRAQLLQPNVLEIADTVAWISLKQGWIDDAVASLRELVRKQPGNRSFRNHLLAAIEQMNNHTPVVENLKTALKADPSEENNKQVLQILQGSSQRPK